MLADKISTLRKKHGLSQEAFAEQLDVSRQAVSKWESGSTFPEIDKIVRMSEMFGVTTDYLLKDAPNEHSEIPEEKGTVCDDDPVIIGSDTCEDSCENEPKESGHTRRVTVGELSDYISGVRKNAFVLALSVLLCIVSPALLIFLLGASEYPGIAGFAISQEMAVAFGVALLLLVVAVATAGFILVGLSDKKLEAVEAMSLGGENDDTFAMLSAESARCERPFAVCLVIGIVLCILSPLPLIFFSVAKFSGFHVLCSVAALLAIVAVGVFLIVCVCTVKERYDEFLNGRKAEETTSRTKTRKAKMFDAIEDVYWIGVTAAYLVWSFASMKWHITWIIWVIAALAWAAIDSIFDAFNDTKDK